MTAPRRVRFWLRFAAETLGGRRLGPLCWARLTGAAPVKVHDIERVPPAGPLVLATNHPPRGAALDQIAVIATALSRRRPDTWRRLVVVSGRRADRQARGIAHPWQSVAQPLITWTLRRWQPHNLRIPWRNAAPSITSLRQWRTRAPSSIMLVFPEGRAGKGFGVVRPGAGRWLAAGPSPVIPVAAWQQEATWHVRFGHPIHWTPVSNMRDVHLGLAIAALLPAEHAAAWQDLLLQWRQAQTEQ